MKFKIKIPIFNESIFLYVGKIKEVAKKYNLGNISNYDAFCFRTERKEVGYVAVFKKGVKKSIIVHESVHLCNMILKDIGHKIDAENDEVQCYLTQYIYEQIKFITNN